MKIRIIMETKMSNGCVKNLIEEYFKRVSNWCKMEFFDVKSDMKSSEKVLKLSENFYRVGLDVNGREMDSMQFAKWLKEKQGNVAFIIGGADGLSDVLKKKCDELFSLSKLTFAHEHALLLLSEQIYRGFTINFNHPYHK